MKTKFERIIVMALLAAGLAVAATGCTKAARAKHAIEAANADFEAERYDAAEAGYKRALQLGGMNAYPVGQLGRIFQKEGRTIDAARFLAEATRLDPNSLPFQMALGQTASALHDVTNTVKISTRILGSQPNNEEALILLLDSGIPNAALAHTLAAIPKVADNPAYPVVQGVMALRDGQFSKAEALLHSAATANPKSSAAYFALAQVYAAEHQEAAGAQALKAAADTAPLRSAIRVKYTEFLVKSGKADAAREVLENMTSKAPDYIPGWAALMNLKVLQKKYDEAEKCADTILARDSVNFDAMQARGMIELANHDPGKALITFQRMAALYKKSPQPPFDMAQANLMMQDKASAVGNLNQSLIIDPAFAPAVLMLAQMEMTGGRAPAAADRLNALIKKYPGLAQAHALLAEVYLTMGRPESAIATYQAMEKAAPKNPELPLLIGAILLEQHKNAEARAEFEQSAGLVPGYPRAVEQLVLLDLAENKNAEAAKRAQEQIDRFPKSGEPWALQEQVDLAAGNLAAAEKDAAAASRLDPNVSKPYFMLADAYGKANKNAEAVQKLNDLVSRTNDPGAYLQLGAIHETMKDHKAAAAAYEQVLKQNPHSLAALNNLAFIDAVYLNDTDRAYELAERARAILPDNPSVADTLGWCIYKKSDYARALAVLENAVAKAPSDPDIQFHLGMTQYMTGNEEAARGALRRALALDPNYHDKEEAARRLAILDTDPASAPGAQDLLEKALKENPDDPVILKRLAGLAEARGKPDDAAGYYEKIVKHNPENAPVMARLAGLYGFNLKQMDKATNLASAAHKLAPDSPEVSAVLGRVLERQGDYARAAELLEGLPQSLPHEASLLHDTAWALYGVGRIADAQAAMQKALQAGPPFPESDDARDFLTLADGYGSPAKFQAAADLAKKILQTNAAHVPALLISGAAAEQAGDAAAARTAYTKAVAAMPLCTPAARQLALLDATHFPDDAAGFTAAEKASSAFPDDAPLMKSLGVLGYRRGKFQRSADALQLLTVKTPQDGEAFYYLAKDYEQLKQPKQAKQAYAKAVTLPLTAALASDAKQSLAALK